MVSCAKLILVILLFAVAGHSQVNCVCPASTTGSVPAGGTPDWVIANTLFTNPADTPGRCLIAVCNPPAARGCAHIWAMQFDVVLLNPFPPPPLLPPYPVVTANLGGGLLLDVPPVALVGNVLSYFLGGVVSLECGQNLFGVLNFTTGGVFNFSSGFVSMTCGGC